MALPYDCGALAPRHIRLQDERYIRFQRPQKLQFNELVELCAFVRIVGLIPAGRIFQWFAWDMWHVQQMCLKDPVIFEASEPFHVANLNALRFEDAMRMFEVMKENGWKRGSVPLPVKRAASELRGRGHNLDQVAQIMGVHRSRISAWTRPGQSKASKRARAATALSLAP